MPTPVHAETPAPAAAPSPGVPVTVVTTPTVITNFLAKSEKEKHVRTMYITTICSLHVLHVCRVPVLLAFSGCSLMPPTSHFLSGVIRAHCLTHRILI